jgi:hypothetical protein
MLDIAADGKLRACVVRAMLRARSTQDEPV